MSLRKPEPVPLKVLGIPRHRSHERELRREREEVDAIHVYKSSRELCLLSAGRVVRRYDVAFGPAYRDGHKRRQGDNRTPEGVYRITSHNSASQFHLSLKISYPNDEDRAGARARGVSPGDWIMIHGLGPERAWAGKDHVRIDWTEGCIAVTNEEIEEIFSKVKDGTPVAIFGVDVPADRASGKERRPLEEQPSVRHARRPPARPVPAERDAYLSRILSTIFGGGGGYKPGGPRPVLEAAEVGPFGY